MYEFFQIKNPYKFKSAENPAMGEEWLDNASVQYRNSFANKTNNAIKEAIQEVVNELGPRNLGMLAGRRWVNGESDSDIIDHVRKNGGNISDYALGKVEYMTKNPGEVATRDAKKVHDHVCKIDEFVNEMDGTGRISSQIKEYKTLILKKKREIEELDIYNSEDHKTFERGSEILRKFGIEYDLSDD
jgi:hypothetical protein